MVHTFYSPEWFLIYELILHIAFALITAAVSYYAFRVYNLVKEPQPKLFGIAFGLFSLSYIIQFFLELVTLIQFREATRTVFEALLDRLLDIAGLYFHVVLFTIGLLTLTYMTLKVKSAKIYSLILFTTLISLLFASNTFHLFCVLSSFFLLFILIHYLANYLHHKQRNTLRALIAFALMFIGSLPMIFYLVSEAYYVAGHVIEGIAYVVLLLNLILAVKK